MRRINGRIPRCEASKHREQVTSLELYLVYVVHTFLLLTVQTLGQSNDVTAFVSTLDYIRVDQDYGDV